MLIKQIFTSPQAIVALDSKGEAWVFVQDSTEPYSIKFVWKKIEVDGEQKE